MTMHKNAFFLNKKNFFRNRLVTEVVAGLVRVESE